MKCKVEFSSYKALHITHNDSDGIGCGLVTHYLEEHNSKFPWIDTKHPFTTDTTEFMPIPTAVKTITSLLRTFIDILNGKDIEDLDKDIIEKYVFIDDIYSEEYGLATLPSVIYISDLPLNDELIQLVNTYLEAPTKLIIGDIWQRLIWFDHHTSTKKYTDSKYDITDWFIHSEEEYPGENISAAELMVKYFKEHTDIYSDSNPTKASTYVFDVLIPEISRYDTWEWRKNPQSNDDEQCTEWHVQALISAYKNPYIAFNKIIKCVDSGNAIDDCEEFLLIYNIRNISLQSAIFSAKKNYRLVKLTDIEPTKFADMDYNVALMIADSAYGSLVMESIYNSEPNVDIVISIYPTTKNLSFRCSFKREDIHLDEIAERVGGGGHSAAAGANVSKELILNIFDLYYSTEPANLIKE